MLMLLFFFFKQKTAYEMRISDWSSDVCSSDLRIEDRREHRAVEGREDHDLRDVAEGAFLLAEEERDDALEGHAPRGPDGHQEGREQGRRRRDVLPGQADRKSVV